jgi:hypothetical protein
MNQDNWNTGATFNIRHVIAIDPQHLDAWRQAPCPGNVRRRRLAGGKGKADESDDETRELHVDHHGCDDKGTNIMPVHAKSIPRFLGVCFS